MKLLSGNVARSALSTILRGVVSLAVLGAFLSNNSQAAVQAWNPNGTASVGGNGVWDLTTPNWTPAGTQTQVASPVAWVVPGPPPATANAAVFCAGPTGSANQGTFTVTVNDIIPMGGIFNGGLSPGPCTVTLTGPGSLNINQASGGLAAFSTRDSSIGNTKIMVPITGTNKVNPQNTGQLYLLATNTYSGGTQLGYSGASFSGIINFNSGSSFGTGNLIISNTGTGLGAFVYNGTSAVTITNKITWSILNGGVNIVGAPAGVTFSGTAAFAAATTNANFFTGGASSNLVIMSGVISSGKAGGFLNKGNPGILRFSAANTYNLTTTVSNGVLQAGANGAIPSGSGKGDLIVAVNLNAVDIGKFDVNGFSVTCNGLFGDGIIDNTAAGAGTITFGGNNVSGSFSGSFQNTGGPLNITKTGTGTETINAGTYTGNTTINGGVLILNGGGNSVLPAVSPVSIASGAVLDVQFQPLTMTNLAGRGMLSNCTSTLTVANNSTTNSSLVTYSCFSGGVDNGALVKIGNGALSLRGTNNLPNGVTIQEGTLSVGAGPDRIASAGGAVLTINNGATFQLDAATQTIAQISGTGFINLGGGTLDVNTPLANTYGGVIRDSDLGPNSTATGHGLRGYYYDNQDFSSLLAVRDDAQILFTNFTLPDELPAQIYPNTNQFSARWVGQVLAPVSGNYIFSVAADDGVRLWVGGFPVIDGWTTGNSVRNGTAVTLNGNTRYDIVVEYFNQTGGANCTLRWTPPGDATSTAIPSDYLFLPTAGNVVKDGAGSLQLTAANSYTGATIVNAGTLEASADGALGFGNVIVQDGATLTLDNGTTQNYIADTADLVVSNSAVVNLNFSGTDVVRSFSTDGGTTLKAAGVYGPIGSGAQFTDSHLAGTGRIQVLGKPSTTTLGSSGSTTVYGSTVTLTAVAHGSGTTPTGTITFFDGANAMATVAVDGTGTAVLAVTDLLVATSPHSIKAVYNGDATFAPSTSSAVSQTVTAITLTGVTGANKQYDQTATAPLNLTNLIGVLPIDTNLVQLATNYTATFPDKNAGTNKAITASAITLQGAAAGNYTIASTANVFGNISAKPLTVTNVTASAKVYDGTLSATVNASAAGITGSSTNVIYAGDDATLNTAAATGAFTNASVGNSKTVLFTVPMNGVDAGNYWASGSTTANITKGTSALTLTSSANPANAGDGVNFTATVTPVATGNVNFLTNGVLFSTVALSGSTANSGATTTLPVGTTTVSAEYAGDGNVTGSTNSLQQTISNAAQSPTMTIVGGTGSITITWTGTFNLQSVSALQSSGTPWQTIPGATSPYIVPTTNTARLYRLSN